MADWNEHVLNVRARLDKASKQEMLDSVRYVFAEGANIDFNNKENLKSLHALADVMKQVFSAAGNTKIDFTKMMELPGPELFDGLKDAAKEFESVWASVVEKMGSYSLKQVFMKDQQDLNAALNRINSKGGKQIEKSIERALTKDIKTRDINRLLNEATGVETEFNAAESWEERSAAALRYMKIRDKILDVKNSSDFDPMDIERQFIPLFKNITNSEHKLGSYLVRDLKDAIPQIQTSLYNIFRLRNGESLLGFTDDGQIDIKFTATPLNPLEIGAIFGQKGKNVVEVPVEFKTKLDLMRDLFTEGNFDQLEKLQDEMASMFPENLRDQVLERLEKFIDPESLKKVTDRSYQAIWKDFVGFGMPTGDSLGAGGGVGDGVGSGGASSSELENLRRQLEAKDLEIAEANRKREEAELAERVAQDEAAAERHATEAAEEKAETYRAAMNSMQEEMDNLRAQLANQVGVTGSGNNAGQTDGATTEEVENLERIRAKVAEITTAVELKTKAFTDEALSVNSAVESEIKQLGDLETKVRSVSETLAGLLNNIRNGEENLDTGLSNIIVNVNHAKESEAPAETVAQEPWALDKTLLSVKETLVQIQTNTTPIVEGKTPVQPKSTLSETRLSEIKELLSQINGKIGKSAKTIGSNTKQTTSVLQGRDAQVFEERIKTQKLALKKFRTELETSGRMTDETSKKIRGLAISLGRVKDAQGLTRWGQKFQQQKTISGIGALETREDTVRKSKEKADSERRLTALYRELGVAEAKLSNTKEDTDAYKAIDRNISDLWQQIKLEGDLDDALQKQLETTRQLAKEKTKRAQAETMGRKSLNKVAASSRAGRDILFTATTFDFDVLEKNAEVQKLTQSLEHLDNVEKRLADNNWEMTKEDSEELAKATGEVNKYTAAVKLLVNSAKMFGDDNSISLNRNIGAGDIKAQLISAANAAHGAKFKFEEFDDELQTITGTLKVGPREFRKVTIGVNQFSGAIRESQGALKKTETFIQSFKRKLSEISSYFSASSVIFKAVNEIKKGVQYVRDIDLALTELKKVTDETEETYRKFLKTAAKTADKVGSTIQKVVSSTADWARLNI